MMRKSSKALIALLLSSTFGSVGVAAQNDSVAWRDFSYVKRSEAWLTCYNASGLGILPVNRISIAELYVDRQKGKFANYYQSDNCYEVGVQTASFYRLNPRVVFYGDVSYGNFTGRNMGGSAFIHPYEQSFDIVEYRDDTRGKKNLETYHLTGAVSATLYKGLGIGAKIDYTAANYAKQRDLRHKNKLLDMYLTAGLCYKINPSVEIGANYYYRRSNEGISFSIYGTTDRPYTSLISYGAFFGISEDSRGAGYTNSETKSEKPMFNEYQGVAVQWQLNFTPKIYWFSEAVYKSRDGYYGERSPFTVTYSQHQSDIWEYNGRLSFRKKENLHYLKMNVRIEHLENFQNVYRTQTSGGAITSIVYYDPLKTTDRTNWVVNLSYTGNWGVTGFNPVWMITAGADCSFRKQTVSVYPYYRKQTIRNTEFYALAERNVMRKKEMYTFSLGASFLSGGGTAGKDGLYASPSTGGVTPSGMESYLHSEYEFLTSKQAGGSIAFKYSRSLGSKGLKGYTSFSYNLRKAFNLKYLKGDKRNDIRCAVGCTF